MVEDQETGTGFHDSAAAELKLASEIDQACESPGVAICPDLLASIMECFDKAVYDQILNIAAFERAWI